MKITLYTQWKDKELVCCCPPINKCNKNHGCEELDFILDPYADSKQCMKHDSHIRINGRVQQRR
jgi:hypothetical protein